MTRDLYLLPNADRRLRLGHAWVFSNEVDTGRTVLTAYQPGDLAVVRDAYGKPVGTAYVNPGALIVARLLTSNAKATIDAAWWAGRFRRAIALRDRLYPLPYYRAVYGESDGCPGIVVDRYGSVLVLQLNTAGTVKLRAMIVQALQDVLQPAGILVRSAASVRQLEGIGDFDESIGDVPEDVLVTEGELTISAPLRRGQKTGYYYDQRDNRARLKRYVGGRRVLDMYSYVGAWGVRAAVFGAAQVTCCDSSDLALEFAKSNAQRSGVSLQTIHGDAFEVLSTLQAGKQRFDVVVVDPPAFI